MAEGSPPSLEQSQTTRVGSPTFQGDLFVWIQNAKKDLETALPHGVNERLLLKNIETIQARLWEVRDFTNVVLDSRSRSSSPDAGTEGQQEDPTAPRTIWVTMEGSIRIHAFKEKFREMIRKLVNKEGRIYKQLDSMSQRNLNMIGEALGRIMKLLKDDKMAKGFEDFSTLEKKKGELESALKELHEMTKDNEVILGIPPPLMVKVQRSKYSIAAPLPSELPSAQVTQEVTRAAGTSPGTERVSIRVLDEKSRRSLSMSPNDSGDEEEEEEEEVLDDSWLENHVQLVKDAKGTREKLLKADEDCRSEIDSLQSLYDDKKEQFFVNLKEVEDWIEETQIMLQMRTETEQEKEESTEEEHSSVPILESEALLNALKKCLTTVDSQGHKIQKVLVVGRLVRSILDSSSASELKKRLENLKSNSEPLHCQIQLRIAQLDYQHNRFLIGELIEEAWNELRELPVNYQLLDPMKVAREGLQEFFYTMEFEDKVSKGISILSSSAEKYIELGASNSEEVRQYLQDIKDDYDNLCSEARRVEEFLKEGITNWERLNATCASFSEWVSTSETVVDREFFGTTVKEAETLYNAILGLIEACDDKQLELEEILSIANHMQAQGAVEEATVAIDNKMEELKSGWVRLCQKLEQFEIEVKEVVGYWNEYIEVYQEVLTFITKMNGKLPRDPIQSTLEDQSVLKKYRDHKKRLLKVKPKFDRLVLFGRKLIDSGRIQNSESFASDLQEVEHQWQLVNDNITASCEALSQEHRDLIDTTWQAILSMVEDGESLLMDAKDEVNSLPVPVVMATSKSLQGLKLQLGTLRGYFTEETLSVFDNKKDYLLSKLQQRIFSPDDAASPVPLEVSQSSSGGVGSPIAEQVAEGRGLSPGIAPKLTEEDVKALVDRWAQLVPDNNNVERLLESCVEVERVWGMVNGDVGRCNASLQFAGTLDNVKHELAQFSSYFTETRLSELKFEMDHMNEISQHLSSATVDNEETAHLYGKLQIYQSTVPELRKQAASIDMLTTQVISRLAMLMDTWSTYLDATAEVSKFLEGVKENMADLKHHLEIHEQEETNLSILPSALLNKVQVVCECYNAAKPHFQSVLKSGSKICSYFRSNEEPEVMDIKSGMESLETRWNDFGAKLTGVAEKCNSIQMDFQDFLLKMATFSDWIYEALHKLEKAISQLKESQETDNGEDPINLWVVVQEVEVGIDVHKEQANGLPSDQLPWQQLEFLEEDPGNFCKAFIDDLEGPEGTDSSVDSPKVNEGVSLLLKRWSDIAKKVQDLRYELESKSDEITLICNSLEGLYMWIKQQEEVRVCLRTPPTTEVNTGMMILKDLKSFLRDIESREVAKATTVQNVNGVLHQLSPAKETELKEKLDSLLTTWRSVMEACQSNIQTHEQCLPMMEEMWKRIIAFEEYLCGVDKKIEEVLPVEADLPHLEHQQDLFSTLAEEFPEHSPEAVNIKNEWERLIGMYPSLKDPPPQYEQHHSRPSSRLSGSLSPDSVCNFDFGSLESKERDASALVEKLVNKTDLLETKLAGLPEEVKTALEDIRSFMEEYTVSLTWFSQGKVKLEKEMSVKHCIGVTQNVLEEHMEFLKDVSEQKDKLPELFKEADELLQCYPPGKWLQERIDELKGLVAELDCLSENRTTHLSKLLAKWNKFEEAYKTLIDWTTQQGQFFSGKITNKEDFGVEEHLQVCKALKRLIEERRPAAGLITQLGEDLEGEDGKKPNGSTDVLSRMNDISQHWKSFEELSEETDLRLRAAYSQLQDMLQMMREQKMWLKGIQQRCTVVQPSYGDQETLAQEITRSEALQSEVQSHQDDIQYIKDSEVFIVEHSKKTQRPKLRAAITAICESYSKVRDLLELRLAHLKASVPLWESFDMATESLAEWLAATEETLASDKCQSGDLEKTESAYNRISDLYKEAAGKQQEFNDLSDGTGEILQVLDMEEDRDHVTHKTDELCQNYVRLLKELKEKLEIFKEKIKSWEQFPVGEAVEVEQYLAETQLDLEIDFTEDDDGDKIRDMLEKLEKRVSDQDAHQQRLTAIAQSLEDETMQDAATKNPDITMVTDHLNRKWAEVQESLKSKLEEYKRAFEVVSDLEQKLADLKKAVTQHRNLLQAPPLPGPQLELQHEALLSFNKSLVTSTKEKWNALKKARNKAKNQGVVVPTRLMEACDSALTETKDLSPLVTEWTGGLTEKMQLWLSYKDNLYALYQTADDVNHRMVIGIDSSPIGDFLPDLPEFRRNLEALEKKTGVAERDLASLEKDKDVLLFGDSSPVQAERGKLEEIGHKLKEVVFKLDKYFDRVKSWEEYMEAVVAAQSWIGPFKKGVTCDIEEFGLLDTTADPTPFVKRFREHQFAMDQKEPLFYRIRDYPLSVEDVESERESVADIINERDSLIETFEELKEKLSVAFQDSEALEIRWRNLALENARQRTVLEARVLHLTERNRDQNNTIVKLNKQLKSTRRGCCGSWKVWLCYFVFLDVVIISLLLFKPKVLFPCNACGGAGPFSLETNGIPL